MNKRQNIALGVGLVLIVLAGLNPPYMANFSVHYGFGGEYQGQNMAMSFSENIGFYFLLTPPKRSEVAQKFSFDEIAKETKTEPAMISTMVNITLDTSLFLVEIIVLILVTCGAVLLLKGIQTKNPQATSEQKIHGE